jgi:hypothetical protein
MQDLNNRFLDTITKSLEIFLNTSSRSNAKLKPLHGNIKRDLNEKMKKESIDTIHLTSLDLDDSISREDSINGRYYNKNVDISIKINHLKKGAIGVKFVMNNYMQNANNYFENMLGETANIRANNIPYFQILILFDKMPYFKNGGVLSKWEIISKDTHLKKYIKLSEDNIDKYYHTPNLTLLTIISLPPIITEDKKILNKKDFNNKLLELLSNKKLELTYSTKFESNIFQDNIILNNYEKFLNRMINYFLFKGILQK